MGCYRSRTGDPNGLDRTGTEVDRGPPLYTNRTQSPRHHKSQVTLVFVAL